ncbi:MAG: ABC transporter permease [Mucilaginibacter sp.]|uniref:ABC transporter permease n=1 Tax=Mucilaginibacter sp. TaxID=1882438 RepID=UPI0031AF3EEE
MIKIYFKTAFRSLVKNRFYTAINIVGLTAGMTVGLLIFIWVQNELSYDSFHRNSPNIYKVLANIGKGSSQQIWPNSNAPLAVYAKSDIPEVVNSVRIKSNHNFSLFKYADKQFIEKNTAFVDPSFFTVFDFKLLKGSVKMPFNATDNVIITKSVAKRYFGDQNPVGKVLVAENQQNLTVSGVIADFGSNSSIKYDMIFPMDLYARLYSQNNDGKSINTDWRNFTYDTFLQLRPGASLSGILDKLGLVLINHFKDIGIKHPYSLQALTKVHLYKTDGSDGLIQTVRVFIIVGLLILMIACINYVNLSTAQSIIKAKEISVRKIIGAQKVQLFIQFFVETMVLFFFASALALVSCKLLLPVFNNISGTNITSHILTWQVWVLIGGTILFALLLSSIYPSWLLASIQPINALKGKVTANISSVFLRKVLVTMQFVFSVAIIAGTFIINKQLSYIHKKELGYDREQVFTLQMRGMQPHADAIKTEILKQQGVSGVAYAGDDITNLSTNTTKTDWDGKDPEQTFFVYPVEVDKDFLSVFKIKLATGHGFTGMASDSAHFILNETAVNESGITNPLGKRFKLGNQEGTIIGVVKDFHFASLKQKIKPAIFSYRPQNNQLYVKTTGNEAEKAISAVGRLWKQYNAGFPYEYSFLDDNFNSLYQTEQRTGTIFNLFSVVAILISCLGLFGLTTFTIHTKVKEIGIRKVLGASNFSVVRLLAKDFIRPVLIAIMIGIPPAWYALHNWLQSYAYRTEMQWWVFALAGISTIIIALFTISFQSFRAAAMNPVKSIKID